MRASLRIPSLALPWGWHASDFSLLSPTLLPSLFFQSILNSWFQCYHGDTCLSPLYLSHQVNQSVSLFVCCWLFVCPWTALFTLCFSFLCRIVCLDVFRHTLLFALYLALFFTSNSSFPFFPCCSALLFPDINLSHHYPLF